jgi:cysteine desulfurase
VKALAYLDHNAITPVRPEAKAAVSAALEVFGNPSSVHAAGRAARDVLDLARARVAAALGARTPEIVFTGCHRVRRPGHSGRPRHGAAGRDGRHRAVEHPCVLSLARALASSGRRVTVLPVDREGLPDLEAARAAITPRTALACAMLANNEIGVLLPVRELAAMARGEGALFFADAAQAVAKVPVDVQALGVDLLSLTGQKLGPGRRRAGG